MFLRLIKNPINRFKTFENNTIYHDTGYTINLTRSVRIRKFKIGQLSFKKRAFRPRKYPSPVT